MTQYWSTHGLDHTYNKLTIYLLLIFISELLEYYIVKYVVLSIVCFICCYIFVFLINYLLSIDKSQKKNNDTILVNTYLGINDTILVNTHLGINDTT